MNKTKFPLIALAIAGLLTIAFIGCKKDLKDPSVTSDGKTAVITTPTVSCEPSTTTSEGGTTMYDIALTVTAPAGGTGLPAGFSVQWMTAADYAANGGWYLSDDPRLCKASFSGNANLSQYNLAAGKSVTIQIGDIMYDNGASAFNCGGDGLYCGTDYVFRVFGHATSTITKSAFSSNLTCSTLPCDPTCGRHHYGYWRNSCDQLTALTIAGIDYSTTDLCTILKAPGTGNGLTILAHQLIPALMSGATYDDPTAATYSADVAAAIAAIANNGSAYNLLTGSTAANWQRTLSGVLNRYNSCQ